MVFFNYSTRQMAAKIVYYGPGLGGKTTNLQYIYDHTSSGSRGEMISLETDTDRTLFFDLLPINVGKIDGFDTRIQLYTVPGQVFYNATRKLVLKGVDGVVFVADSQRPMLDTNLESMRNLEENLGVVGINVGEIPTVLQFNKRDLPGVCSIDEMNDLLNRHGWPVFEASAVSGAGIFETLASISKLTLQSVKNRQAPSGAARAPTAAPRRRMPTPTAPTIGATNGTGAAVAEPPAANSDSLTELAKRILTNPSTALPST